MNSNDLNKVASDNFIGVFKISAEQRHFGHYFKHISDKISQVEHIVIPHILLAVLLVYQIILAGCDDLFEEMVVSLNALLIEPWLWGIVGLLQKVIDKVIKFIAVHEQNMSNRESPHDFKSVICFFSHLFQEILFVPRIFQLQDQRSMVR